MELEKTKIKVVGIKKKVDWMIEKECIKGSLPKQADGCETRAAGSEKNVVTSVSSKNKQVTLTKKKKKSEKTR